MWGLSPLIARGTVPKARNERQGTKDEDEGRREDSRVALIRKAVFPAAGLGTRFLPATKAQPKEMLPLVDKPTIQYVVEEAVASGLEEIILVTGRNKRAIEDHFDAAFELEYYLNDRGKTEELAQIKTISELASEYRRADDWVPHALAELPPEAHYPAGASLATDAAFHLYARGARDYEP